MRRVTAFLRSGKGLPTFAALTLGWMILVVLEGAVVRATGSGAGCGDHWPLCNGQILPHHPRLATVIEFTHRSMTGFCTSLTAALIAWTFLAHRPGHRARKAAVWTGILLLTEALLGAVLVLGGFVEHNTSNLRVLVQGVHFTNTMLLLAALSLTWWWQRPRRAIQSCSSVAPRITSLCLLLTVLTGATGSVAALADTLFPAPNLHAALLADLDPGSPLLIRMRWMHPAAALASFVLILVLALGLRRGKGTLLTLMFAQIVLGVADVLALAPLTLQVLHLLAADLLWIALVVITAGVHSAADERTQAPSNSGANVSAALA
ncbi:MAG TPA: COX15/CtaA family protein [Acidobacteriaceae bacterium]|nr:COX15/CtaA family protein [Acidobacteriaceae bacterium]